MFIRKQVFQDIENESAFLWGARQTGKSTLLKLLYPDSLYFDLLLGREFERFQRNPSLLKDTLEFSKTENVVIIDEIQRIPALLFEVQWLIVNKNIRFILSGSSPRKIIRNKGNLLGGRALRFELYPLIYKEIPDFDLMKAVNNGLLPRHYQANNAEKLLAAYIGNYLTDEISAEAKIRNIPAFSHFLEAAAFSNRELVNYSNIATDIGISMPTVKEYFHILEDTLIGRYLPSFQKKPKRRVIHAPKFYFFDIGIVNFLLRRGRISFGSEAFGKTFEHFIYLEIFAHSKYSGLNYPINYWRTTSQLEVDFVLGNGDVAIEVKSTDSVNNRHLKGLNSFAEEYPAKKLILVSNDPYPRKMNAVTILPWKIFLDQLWAGEII